MPPTRPLPTKPAGRVAFLDYLRIFAFASVLAGHKFNGPVQAAAQSDTSPWRWLARGLWPFIEGGGAGVVVFFLVSGYIITQVLQRERTPEFLLKRVFRIYPLYVVALLAEHALLRQRGHAPGLDVVLPQLLLMGDWFGTPYALGGVEWTLRLEVLFYALMAILRAVGLTFACRGTWLLSAYLLLMLTFHALGPIATHTDWTRGYITLYLPFLLLGSVIWLREHGAIRWPLALMFLLLVFGLYRLGLHAWQPRWVQAPFAALAVALFLLLWSQRQRLRAPRAVLAVSELTYAVYLVHNWLFDVLRDAALRFGMDTRAANMIALLLLLAVCSVLVRAVERPGVRVGRWLAARLPARSAVS